ncbi:MAG: toll/interleukin-1 receptor domain-containing protein [Nitrosomonas sp.]|uniref:toll/interleukin-1 receptor domain-containing protein n=1 Tax=Nitrosomonas sp. TaxID=42353 RepID=UPI0027329A41|nr:toll/interleukin-1 receptor domain-containing protein [Nitrosomonas sp.]MDP3281744.1 toll/interleukin-1 receptor domain-containing protein [Nitrosomonas sp.]
MTQKNNPLHLFISHLSSNKRLATELAEHLEKYNINPFVAHEDITPTMAWQEEIENFLKSTHCLLALLNTGYSKSTWCNQEVGFCLGRGIPLISFKIEEDPMGFIGKLQAYTPAQPINPRWEAYKIVELIQGKASQFESIRSWVVSCFHLSHSFYATNRLCSALDGISLSEGEIEQIKNAFNSNSQVSGANDVVNILGEEWIKAKRAERWPS